MFRNGESMKSNSLLWAGGLLFLGATMAAATLATEELGTGAALLLAAAPLLYVAGKYSLKSSLVGLLLVVALFLPKRFDLTWVVMVLGAKVTFVMVLTFLVDGILLMRLIVRSATGSLWPTRHPRYYVFALLFLLGSIPLSLLWAVAGGSPLDQRVQDALPAFAPLLLCLLLSLEGWSRAEVRFLAFVAIANALAVSVLAFAVGAGFAPLYKLMGWHNVSAWANRPFAAMGSANTIGSVLLLCLPLALALYETSSALWMRAFALVCGGFMLAGIVLGGSRFVLGLAFLYLLVPARRIVSKALGRVLQYVAVAALLVFVLLSAGKQSYFKRYAIVDNASTRARIASVYPALLIFADNPLLGTGLGTFYRRGQERLKYGVAKFKGEGHKLLLYKGHVTLEEPHNIYLMWLAELGIVGFGALVFFGAVVWRHCISALRARARPDDEDLLLKGFFWGVALFAASNLSYSIILNYPRAAVLFWTILALTVELASQKLALSEPQVWRRGWAVAGARPAGEARPLPVDAVGNAPSSVGSL